MEKISITQQLLNNTIQLIESNKQLVKTNTDYFNLLEQLNERQEKILACFGVMYTYINSKTLKTWEEHNQAKELFDLITHQESR
jgi:cytoplasmic iron level regulating protein YaaA (DUF328/UPF0246 family)